MGEQAVEQRRANFENTGFVYPQDNNVESLSGDKTLSYTDAAIQVLDPNGAGRNVDLPADQVGQAYLVVNTADAAEDLTVRDADNNTIHAVSQGESAYFVNTGNGYVVVGGGAASGGQEV